VHETRRRTEIASQFQRREWQTGEPGSTQVKVRVAATAAAGASRSAASVSTPFQAGTVTVRAPGRPPSTIGRTTRSFARDACTSRRRGSTATSRP